MSIKLSNSIFIVDSHTAGHPTRIVVGGLPKIQGDSVAQRRDYVKSKMDDIRRLLCNEPRGHSGMYGAILTEPGNKEADFGVIFYSTLGYDDMCGHGTIGVATVLIETNMIPWKEPLTEVALEAPAGLIRVKAKVTDGKVKSVSLVNVPAFLYKKDISIPVPGYGEVKGDVAFGGNWYFYINAKEIGIRVRSENVDDLIKAGSAVRNEFNRAFDLVHPADPNISKKLLGVSIIDAPVKNKDAAQNNAMVEGRLVDRSPCGTGTCGRMAILFARNKLGLNEDFVNESISGSAFRGRLIEETKVGEYPAVVPEITGSAYITGFNHVVLDPDDPLGAKGFLLGQKL
ncbi:MAG: proline racemase family protein [Dehalococcoidia bacterium]|nr:MAG: proline racemase family protein [Dehalococcoidia bacterium]